MRVLLFEYLHAHPEWYRTASSSMKAEGRAMLEAVATDLSRLGVPATIAVCPEALKGVSVPLPVFETTACTLPDFVRQTVDGTDFDAVFPIAPESEGTLLALVQEFQEHERQVLTLPIGDVETFSDKWKTFLFLSKHNLPTPKTFLAEEFHELKCNEPNSMVVKPRDGAGCECVEAISADAFADRGFVSATHIVQPRLNGQALSVGLLGSHNGGATAILKPATQRIVWRNNKPAYSGGEIPSQLAKETEHQLRQVCRQLMELIKPVVGYVGVDFFLPDGSDQPLVLEINPRLCSSYIGYRQATRTNLMSMMFEQSERITWSPNRIVFYCP